MPIFFDKITIFSSKISIFLSKITILSPLQSPNEAVHRRIDMALHEMKRLTPAILRADRDAYTALSAFKEYQPSNRTCALEQVAQLVEEMRLAREEEIRVEGRLAAARDASRQAEWRFHNAMLDVKAQVIAQYGFNSDEVQSLGLKKKSEYKKPTRRHTKQL
jgi:hypothetical protein